MAEGSMSSAAQRHEPPPPQDLDAEEHVLGAMMMSSGAIAAVRAVLGTDGRAFYRESHAVLYRAIA